MRKLGLTFSGDTPLVDVLERSREVERLGFHSVWVAEHYLLRDSFSTVAGISASTKKLLIGSGIVSPYTRHVALLAMSSATLSELSGGRFILGLGTNARFLEQLGVSDQKPLRTMRKTITTLRALLAGEEVDLKAVTGSGDRVKLGFTCPHPVPIYLGAIGPKMLELAGEIADGAILSLGSSPGYVRDANSRIESGRSKAKRVRRRFETVCYVMVWEKGDRKAAWLAKQMLVRLLSLRGREALLGELSADERVARIREKLRLSGVMEAAKLVGDDMLELVSITGTRDQCLEGLARFRRAGVTLPVLSPMGELGSDFLRNLIAD